MVSDAYFAKEIEKRIGVQTDTSTVDKELANYENKLKEVDLNKDRLENEMEAITLDNVYKIMQNFGKLYAIMSDEEKKSLITYLMKEIQIYPNGESEMPLKSIEFNFPIYDSSREHS